MFAPELVIGFVRAQLKATSQHPTGDRQDDQGKEKQAVVAPHGFRLVG